MHSYSLKYDFKIRCTFQIDRVGYSRGSYQMDMVRRIHSVLIINVTQNPLRSVEHLRRYVWQGFLLILHTQIGCLKVCVRVPLA
jgi:hypothetical protein